MTTYVVGDVQGCFDSLELLLKKIQFDPDQDRLGFVGDLVNRGPSSLSVLRFIRSLKNSFLVLGNHDVYLLILGYGCSLPNHQHTLHDILNAPDKLELLNWLRQQPFIHYEKDDRHPFLMVHAGIPPQWSIKEALGYAKELQDSLQGPHHLEVLQQLFDNDPMVWTEALQGPSRLRYIANAFTRMRFCSKAGQLNFTATATINPDPQHFLPWFNYRDFSQDKVPILFGHWAALQGHCDQPQCHALDTGCVWGNCLTALRLPDFKKFSVPCQKNALDSMN